MNPPRVSFSGNYPGSGGVQRCARVLSYDAPSVLNHNRDEEDEDLDLEMEMEMEEMDIPSSERVGLRSRPFSGYSHPSPTPNWTYTYNPLLSPTSAQTSTTSSSSSTGRLRSLSGKNRLNLLVFLLALCLATLGVISLMIPDLVGGLSKSQNKGPMETGSGRYPGYPYSEVTGHVGFADLSFGEETLHGLSPPSSSSSGSGVGRIGVVEGLKARAFFPRPESRLRMEKRGTKAGGGRWGFSMGFIGRPAGTVVEGEEDLAGFDESALDHLRADGVGAESEESEYKEKVVVRPGPEVQVVQPEQVQKLLLQQSRDRLRRRRLALQGRV